MVAEHQPLFKGMEPVAGTGMRAPQESAAPGGRPARSPAEARVPFAQMLSVCVRDASHFGWQPFLRADS